MTGTLNNNAAAQDIGYGVVQFLRKTITYLDDGKTVDIGTLPDGAVILKVLSGVQVNIAFNGGTTNTLDVGPSTDSGTNLWGTVLALGAIAFVPLDEAVSMAVSGDTKAQAKVVSTAGASAGSADIVIAYVV
jgi:hypothetical protein